MEVLEVAAELAVTETPTPAEQVAWVEAPAPTAQTREAA